MSKKAILSINSLTAALNDSRNVERYAGIAFRLTKARLPYDFKIKDTEVEKIYNRITEADSKHQVLYEVAASLHKVERYDLAMMAAQASFENGNANAGMLIAEMVVQGQTEININVLPEIIQKTLELDSSALAYFQHLQIDMLKLYTADAEELVGKFSDAATGSALHEYGRILTAIRRTMQPFVDAEATKLKTETAPENGSIADGA